LIGERGTMTDVIDEVADEPVEVAESVVEGQDTGDDAPGDVEPGPDPEAEVIVQIGEEKPEEEERAPSWVKELRQRNRDLAAENRRLRDNHAPEVLTLGKKPEMADFDFDAEKYESALQSWMQRKQAADAQQAETERKMQTAQQAWNTKLAAYGTAKTALNVPDFDNAEAIVLETLSEQQQAIIVKGAKNPALVVLALGKNPKKAKELAALADPVEFAVAVGTLETQLKVTKRTAPPPNDKPVTGTAPRTGTEASLDKLRAEAEKSGDFTKVVEYKRKMREAK
jgi:type II secretory pathway component PulJ